MDKTQTEEWRKQKRKVGGSVKTIKGKFFARVQYLDEATGKRKEKLKEAPTMKKARELSAEMRRELKEKGQFALESDKLTFAQLTAKFETTQLVPVVTQNGLKVAGRRSVNPLLSAIKHLREYFGRREVRRITPNDLEAYKINRLQKPVEIEYNSKRKEIDENTGKLKTVIEKKIKTRERKISGVNRELALLRQIFNYAEIENFISNSHNPFLKKKNIISMSAETERDRILSFNEETSLLKACDNEYRQHITPLIIAALDTAARSGELLKLQWKDVDLNSGVITFQATNTKTEKTRLVGMTSRVQAELSKLWEQSAKNKSDLVFGIKSNFKRAWSSARLEAKIDDLHFHDLRHTGITRMIRAGAPASEVMKISGHTQLKTFQRYINLTNDSVTSAASLLDNFNNSQVKNGSKTLQ